MPQQFLRVVYSPGVQPDKWFNRYDERIPSWKIASAQADDPLKYVQAGAADVAIVRLPSGEQGGVGGKESDLHEVRLYDEQLGVAAPKDHPLKVVESATFVDVEDEIINAEPDAQGRVDLAKVREGLQVVAANVGVVIAPRPLLRAINQPGVVHRDLFDAPRVGGTRVALVWRKDRDADEVQDLVGICRGRKAGSSRQVSAKGKRKRKG